VIILDTNVLSELARETPDSAVLSWLDSQPESGLATTAINAAEMLYGVARLPEGRRKTQLDAAVKAVVREDFRGRVAAFDASAAGHYAAVASERERRGRPIAAADAQIAAICRARGAALATRNTKDFEDTGIALIDPWHESG